MDGGSGRAIGASAAVSERVAIAGSQSPALTLPHERLGADQGMAWFGVADAQLTAMWAVDRSVQLIYFSRAAYDAAMAQLTPAEQSAAIAYRRTRFVAVTQALSHAFGRRVDALAPAAQAGRREIFDRALALLARWFGKRRFERAQPAFLLTRLVEREARLGCELAAAGSAEQAALSESQAHQLAEALARHGSPEYARALPYVGLERGVRIEPGADLAALLEVHHEPHVLIDGALFAPWSLDALPSLRDEGRSATVIYGGRAGLVRAFDGTEPQSRRDLLARVAFAARAPAAPVDEHLINLRVEQSLFKRWTAAAVADTDRALAGDLATQIAAGASGLHDALAASPPASDPDAQLRALDAGLRNDLALFSTMARVQGSSALAADTAELAAQVAAEEPL